MVLRNINIQKCLKSVLRNINIQKCLKSGTIENDTSILINVIYVKAEFYDKNNNLLETKYSEIKYFNVGEKAKFEIEFFDRNVTDVKVTSVEKIA